MCGLGRPRGGGGQAFGEELALKGDVLSVLEAIYAEATDEGTWLKNVLHAAEPLLNHGLGVGAGTYELEVGGFHLETVRHMQVRGTSPALAAALGFGTSGTVSRMVVSAIRRLPDPAVNVPRLYPRYPHAAQFSRAFGNRWRGQSRFRPFFDRAPSWTARFVPDALGVLGGNPAGFGALLTAFVPPRVRVPQEDIAIWTRVAAHLAAGHRLVRARDAATDAVLDPCGRMHHLAAGVDRDEREALSVATRTIDHARGKLRRTDAARAVALWQGLVAGRWTLVDQFDHDGRRFVLAKKNPPDVLRWESLSERENQVLAYAAHGRSHKMVAYLLGISATAVSAHLTKAAEKVGARSRLDLVAAYRRKAHLGPLPRDPEPDLELDANAE
jgi:DNA-binding CsgD family transcriptional regulator